MTEIVYTMSQIRRAVGIANKQKEFLCAEMLGVLEEAMRVQETKEVRRDCLGKGILECLDGFR
ncbi:MAG: hypothetical protein AAB642_03840 [Patescibacteria group bacterium]